MSDREDFYIGYLERAPAGTARWLGPRVVLLLVLGAALAVLLVTSQQPFDPGVFEFGTLRTYEGVVRAEPYPTLELERPGGGTSSWLLVAFGKSGADELVAGLDGRRVRVTGTLVHRGADTMLEVDGELEDLGAGGPPAPATVSLGEQTFLGEIVDTKCFLGVMKPGRDTPHRACATLCIRGGIPPALMVRDARGDTALMLLTDADGAPVNDRVLDKIAEPVTVTGELLRTGDRYVLRTDPDTIRRVDVD